MRPALSAIPDVYIHLAMESDPWFYFVSAIAVVIHMMQCVERVVLPAIAKVLLWPFEQMHAMVDRGASAMVEYLSGSCAILFGVWCFEGPLLINRKVILSRFPVEVWGTIALAVGVLQLYMVSGSNRRARATATVLACALWVWIDLLFIRRIGFSVVLVWGIPLAVFCVIAIAILIKEEEKSNRDYHGPTTGT